MYLCRALRRQEFLGGARLAEHRQRHIGISSKVRDREDSINVRLPVPMPVFRQCRNVGRIVKVFVVAFCFCKSLF